MNDDCSVINTLAIAGVSIKINHSPSHMHNEYIVVDEIRVLTGSYNWNKLAAQYNQEIIVITDNDDIFIRFVDNFSQ